MTSREIDPINRMLPIHSLFEAHLTVSDLNRSMHFYGDVLGLQLAKALPERKVAFYWTGEPGHSMLGFRRSKPQTIAS